MSPSSAQNLIADAERDCRAAMYEAAERLKARCSHVGQGIDIGQLLSVIDDYVADSTADLRREIDEELDRVAQAEMSADRRWHLARVL